MTENFRKEAHMLAAMFAMNAYIKSGMREDEVPDAAYRAADKFMEMYEDESGIVAALKPKRRKK